MKKIHVKYSFQTVETLHIDAYAEENESFFLYLLRETPAVDIEKVNRFFCCISGFPLYLVDPHRIENQYKMYFGEDDSLSLEIKVTTDATLTGTLIGYPGTRREIQQIIDDNGYTLFFTDLGTTMAFTGEPVNFGRSQVGPLLGSTFHAQHLSIRKSILSDVLSVERADVNQDQIDAENAALAFPQFRSAESTASLLSETGKLNRFRIFGSNVEIAIGSNRTIAAQLQDGIKNDFGLRSLDRKSVEGWFLYFPHEQPIPLTALTQLVVHIAGVKVWDRRNRSWNQKVIRLREGFILKESSFSPVEALFYYDDTLSTFVGSDEDIDRFRPRLMRSLVPYDLPFQNEEELTGMTVKLAHIKINMSYIRSHLKALGIKVDKSDEN